MSALTKILKKPIASAVIAILFGFVVAAVVLAAAGFNPADSFAALFDGALGRPKYISNVIIKATPLLLCGVGISFAYKVGLFNIGAEGQYIMGTVIAVVVGYTLNLPAPIQIPLVVLAGAVGGALLGSLVGWLKARFGVHEVITSIMFNWIALYFCNWVVSLDAFHKPNSTATYSVNLSSFTTILPEWKYTDQGIETLTNIPVLGEMVLKTDLNAGIFVAIAAAIFFGWILRRTKMGYEMRAVGANRDASKFAGINVEKNLVLCMAVSGGLCGLAGALTITGIEPHSISTLAAFDNAGSNGLAVAFMAGCSTVGCIPASFLFAGLIYGGQTVQQVMGAPSDIINIMIGTIVFFMALGGVVPMIAERIERKRALKAELAAASGSASASEEVPAGPGGTAHADADPGAAGASHTTDGSSKGEEADDVR